MGTKLSAPIRNLGIAAVLGLLAAALAQAAVITFDGLADGNVVTNQFAADGITFSSAGGQQILITAQPAYQSTPPNFICTGFGSINCTGTVIFSFSAPVSNLQFDGVGNQNAIGTAFALADIYQNGILTVSNLALLVALGNLQPDHQDFSAYSGITQVVIHDNTDPAGTGYDTISFTQGAVSEVPEPLTLSLFGAGLAGALAMRRRATKKS